jgi:hypothetical protein
MSESHVNRFVRSAWALVLLQFFAAAAAVVATGWAAFQVRDLVMQRGGAAVAPAEAAPAMEAVPAEAPLEAPPAGAAAPATTAPATMAPATTAPETAPPAAEAPAPAPPPPAQPTADVPPPPSFTNTDLALRRAEYNRCRARNDARVSDAHARGVAVPPLETCSPP